MQDGRWGVGAAAGAVGLGGGALFLSACCVAPWAVTLFGVGGAVALARLSFLQPAFLLGAVLLLGGAFWIAYRRPSRCREADCQTGSQLRLRRMAWTAAAIVAILALIAWSPAWIGRLIG
jgi:hypothetical protein